ncbi:MAG TPA: hypothetical protein VKS60_21690 [Stellaceae bacterium]|nr:hypothetical protein [Stellaceae bacterium]
MRARQGGRFDGVEDVSGAAFQMRDPDTASCRGYAMSLSIG